MVRDFDFRLRERNESFPTTIHVLLLIFHYIKLFYNSYTIYTLNLKLIVRDIFYKLFYLFQMLLMQYL